MTTCDENLEKNIIYMLRLNDTALKALVIDLTACWCCFGCCGLGDMAEITKNAGCE